MENRVRGWSGSGGQRDAGADDVKDVRSAYELALTCPWGLPETLGGGWGVFQVEVRASENWALIANKNFPTPSGL